MEARITTVTPEMAREWLEHNTNNRNLSSLLVHRYADAIRAGQWVTHNQGVGFDEHGNLLDGQHRLQAIIEAGMPVEMLVVHGVSPVAREVVDIGKRRTAQDALVMKGCRNASYVAGAARLLYHYDTGTLHQFADPRYRPNNSDILDVWFANPGLEDSARVAARLTRILVPSVGTFSHYVFKGLSDEETDTFFSLLSEGVGLEKYSPVLLLRNRLLNNRLSKANLPQLELIALVIKAWNAFRRKQPVRFLRWRTGGKGADARNEDFPRAI